jgi:hypothetical protein
MQYRPPRARFRSHFVIRGHDGALSAGPTPSSVLTLPHVAAAGALARYSEWSVTRLTSTARRSTSADSSSSPVGGRRTRPHRRRRRARGRTRCLPSSQTRCASTSPRSDPSRGDPGRDGPTSPDHPPGPSDLHPRRWATDPSRGLVVHLAARGEGGRPAPGIRSAGSPPLLRHGADLRRREREVGTARHGADHTDDHAEHLRRVLTRRRRPDPGARGLRARLYRSCTGRGRVRCSRWSAPVRYR